MTRRGPIIVPATGVVPDQWAAIARQRKTFLGWPAWSEPEPLQPAKNVATKRSDLHTVAAETTETLIPLADANGVGIEGVRLRLNAWAYRRMHEVTATLEAPGNRKFVTIARVDAWPIDPHLNLKARRHQALRNLPARIDGSHVHRFADNVRLGISAFAPYSNLPAAVPVTETLTSFRDFLRIVGVEFGIDGLDKIDPPNWQELI